MQPYRVSRLRSPILVVDEEVEFTDLLELALGESYPIHTANSPHRALEILRENEIALLITDLLMPEMDGVQLLEQAKKIRPDLLGLLVSGHAEPVALATALSLGFVCGFVQKPWDTSQLIAASIRYYIPITGRRTTGAPNKPSECVPLRAIKRRSFTMRM